MLLPLAASLYAQKDLKTRATQVGIDERGYYQSIQVNGEQILGGKQFPVISAGSQGKVIPREAGLYGGTACASAGSADRMASRETERPPFQALSAAYFQILYLQPGRDAAGIAGRFGLVVDDSLSGAVCSPPEGGR